MARLRVRVPAPHVADQHGVVGAVAGGLRHQLAGPAQEDVAGAGRGVLPHPTRPIAEPGPAGRRPAAPPALTRPLPRRILVPAKTCTAARPRLHRRPTLGPPPPTLSAAHAARVRARSGRGPHALARLRSRFRLSHRRYQVRQLGAGQLKRQ